MPSPETERTWSSILQSGQARAENVGFDLTSYPKRLRCLERLTPIYQIKALLALGAFGTSHQTHTPESLVRDCKVLPGYQRLMSLWLKRLAREGLLEQQGEAFARIGPINTETVEPIWRELSALQTDKDVYLKFLQKSGEQLSSILRGATNPLGLLFPGGSFEVVEAIYQDTPRVQYLNEIISGVVATVESASELTRIAEVGAGIGGTSSYVLPELRRAETMYLYTDVTDFFLNYARKKFSKHAAQLQYALLNIEMHPSSQGVETHAYDVVIASNVLHATRNLHDTLTHVRSLLAPGGVLVLLEYTQHQPIFEISWGLIAGWHLFNDDLRPEQPLLAPDLWASALKSHGFDEIAQFPNGDMPAQVLAQHVMVARSAAES